jgi:NADP-dependent alcohol dehydrogenase
MNNFEFYNPVKIIFGKDQLKKLPSQIPSGQKIMMIMAAGRLRLSKT